MQPAVADTQNRQAAEPRQIVPPKPAEKQSSTPKQVGGTEFTIYLTERGFTLNNEQPSGENTFFSWELAKSVDDEAGKVFGKGLKKQFFDLLSGQRLIESSQHNYERLQNARRMR